MVTDPQTHKQTPTNTQDQLQYTVPQLVRSVNILLNNTIREDHKSKMQKTNSNTSHWSEVNGKLLLITGGCLCRLAAFVQWCHLLSTTSDLPAWTTQHHTNTNHLTHLQVRCRSEMSTFSTDNDLNKTNCNFCKFTSANCSNKTCIFHNKRRCQF